MPDCPAGVVLAPVARRPALDDPVAVLLEADLGVPPLTLEVRLFAVQHLGEIAVRVVVKVLGMCGIDGILLCLQPIARELGDRNVADRLVPDERPPSREQRRRTRPHIDEDQAAELGGLVRLHGALLTKATARLDDVLEGLLDAGAVHRELPAVVLAADAVGLDDTVGEAGAAVRAVAVDDAELARAFPVDHKVLAEHADLLGAQRAVRELLHAAHRMPVATEQLAPRRARTHLSHQGVLFGTEHRGPLYRAGPSRTRRQLASILHALAYRAALSRGRGILPARSGAPPYLLTYPS